MVGGTNTNLAKSLKQLFTLKTESNSEPCTFEKLDPMKKPDPIGKPDPKEKVYSRS